MEAGRITIDGAPAFKVATEVSPHQDVVVMAPPRRYVSRGGRKLERGLMHFGVDPSDRRCLDAGASTGGFTDCLLQHGAAHVLAYDVGYGHLHHRLRTDARVTVIERTNIREVTPEEVPAPLPDLLVCDLSFIGLSGVLPTLRRLGEEDAEAVVLVKPQFEAPRSDVAAGGVVADPAVWRRVLHGVADVAAEVGWGAVRVTPSPLLGPAGNVEFLAHLRPARPRAEEALGEDIDAAVATARTLVADASRDGGGGRTPDAPSDRTQE